MAFYTATMLKQCWTLLYADCVARKPCREVYMIVLKMFLVGTLFFLSACTSSNVIVIKYDDLKSDMMAFERAVQENKSIHDGV